MRLRLSSWAANASIALALVVGVVSTLLVFRTVRDWEESQLRSQFIFHALARSGALQRTVDAGLAVLQSVGGLFDASQVVERDEFSAFLREPLARHPHPLAIEWLPAVPRERRREFEARARAEGFPDFRILERGPDGTPVPAADRPVHFPVWFAESIRHEKITLGFDLASQAVRLAAIARACDTDAASATPRIRLAMAEPEDGLTMFLAVYKKGLPANTPAERRTALEGVIAAVFRIPRLVQGAFRDLGEVDVEVTLLDEQDSGSPVLWSSCAPQEASAGVPDTGEGIGFSTRIEVGGRTWIVVCRPTPAFLAAHARWQPWAALIAGLMFTGLLLGYLHTTHRRTALVESQVAQRTAQLMREVAERKVEQSRLALQHAVTRALAEAVSPHDIAANVLATIGAALRWDAGAIWFVESESRQLRCFHAWNGAGPRVVPFEALCRSYRFDPGVGLPGRIWTRGEPAWIPDLTRDDNFPRASVARAAGLHAAFGVPVRSGGRFHGVMEFFAGEILPPDEGLMAMMTAFGTQIGQLLDRRQAEEALKESEERYRDLFENASDLIQTVDPRGRILYANRAWRETLGYDDSQLSCLAIEEVLHPDAREPFLAALRRACAGEPVAGVETVLRSRSGRTIAVEGTLNCKFIDGRPAYTRSILRDTTARKRVEQMKRDFLSTVSHELRTPLTSIRGALGLVMGGVAGDLPESARPMIGIALRNSERLVRLINDLLDSEKLEAGHLTLAPRSLELMPLIEQALESTRPYADQFGVAIEIAETLPATRVTGDGDRLVQVITNLLANAAKFSPPGGTVTIRVTTSNGSVRVAVEDRGPGIPEPFRPRVFERFAQADSSDGRHRGGTGLGLSIAKALMEQMGGSIGYETGAAGGTVFAFQLPLNPEPSKEARA